MNKRDAETPQPGTAFARTIDSLWRFFSSIKLALILILVITGLSLIGALLIQVPQEYVKDPQLYSSWVNTAARSKVGDWAPFLSVLRLFDVFHSPWFLAAGTLLMLNILVCCLNRWGGIRLTLRGAAIKQKVDFFLSGTNRSEIASLNVSSTEAAKTAQKVLAGRGYRLRIINEGDSVYIAADKNRYFRLGTYLGHLSLILFVLAFIIGSYFGFRNTSFAVAEGATEEVGYETGLTLHLESFVDEYYPDGVPKDYRSQVTLYENGKEVAKKLIRVNYPLVYNGVRFYQSFFGPAAAIQVRTPDGQVLINETVALDSVSESRSIQRYVGFFSLPGSDLSVRLISSATNALDTMIRPGELAVEIRQGNPPRPVTLDKVILGTPRIIGDLEFTYLKEAQYSGFQVSYDPGNMLIWISSVIFLIGISMVLYFPYRQVWVLSQVKDQKSSRILVRMIAPRIFGVTSELQSLVGAMEAELPIHRKAKK